jgi:peptidoglycan DL-endopeptidase CwlO
MWWASFLVFAFLGALFAAPTTQAEPSSIASKEAEVQSVLAQIESLDASLGTAIEAYNLATARLEQVRSDLRQNTHHLVIARATLKRSQEALADRLVALYTSGDDSSTLAVLLGATSLDDFLNRLETVDRVSDQDTRVLKEVVRSRTEVRRRQVRLKHARATAEQLVAERAAHRRSIEQQLAERRQLAASIRSEIERMKAEEARRQAELARQARERAAEAAAAPVFESAATPSSDSSSSESSSAPAAAPAPVGTPSRGGVVGIAMQYLGTPYVWAGASPSGFDCSGFVMYVFAQVGVSLPHSSYAQYGMGVGISRSQLQPGDLVFFDGLGHVGIYIGGNQFIHSPHTGDVVKISSMTGWYSSTFVGGRRV